MGSTTCCVILLSILSKVVLGNHADISNLDIDHVNCGYQTPNCRCRENADVCEFEMELEARNTMIRYVVDQEVNARGIAGTIFYFNETTGDLLPLPAGDQSCANISIGDPRCTPIATADAATFRPYIAINGLFPGPNLIVYENQTLSILVVNRLEQESTSMHWHGLHQNNTPWMDGVDHVTQCGILPGTSFRYIFKAAPSGTFWYHSHTGTQRTDGMFGSLVILERNKPEIERELGSFRDEPENHTITLLEWFPQTTLNFFPALDSGNRFFQGSPPQPTDLPFFGELAPDGSENGNLYFFSGLINGKGKHPNDTQYPYIKSRLSIFSVDVGAVYRFRLVGSQGLFIFRFSIDEHELEVMSTDGYLTQAVTAEYIIIHTGERFDFLLRAKSRGQLNQLGKNDFVIRVELLAIETPHGFPAVQPGPDNPAPYQFRTQDRIEAILHYNTPGTSPPESPEYEGIVNASVPHSCTAERPCRAVNCPFIYHPGYNINCTYIHQLRLLFPAPEHELTLNEPESDSPTLFFNFAIDGFGPHNSVNGRRLRFPSVPAQIITDPTEYQEFVDREVCRDINNRELCRDAINSITAPDCNCAYVADVPRFGRTTRFVLSNLGPQGDFAHPVHLHGHSFFVLDVGFPDYSNNSGFRGCYNDDLNCFIPANINRCDYVNRPPLTRDYTCSNPEWNRGREPSFGPATERINPYTVRKDTVTVPAGGYVVIQFLSDNPGYWIMHCHVETHTIEGMAVVINEARDRQTPPPDRMRRCGNFTWELADFYDRIQHPGPRSSVSTIKFSTAAVLLSVMLSFVM